VETEKRISSLSSGNKKKVAIVQALQHEPRLLILDEPTNGLDPLVQNTLYEILREEHQKGVTIFLSSHVLSEVQRLCDRVAIIKEGRILGVETVDSMRKSLYKQVKVEFTSEKDAEAFFAEISATAALKPDPEGRVRMDGASAIVRKERTLAFLYRGDLKSIVRRVAASSFENLWMEEPSLEEVFLHYYENGGGTT
jgi:ABC-2 type transport system ATP-binding protein